jgi:hypothetical protein
MNKKYASGAGAEGVKAPRPFNKCLSIYRYNKTCLANKVAIMCCMYKPGLLFYAGLATTYDCA